MSEFRYLFTVRQQFGKEPELDCFHKVVSEAGQMSVGEFQVMEKLKPDWELPGLKEDTQALSGMSSRLRFNSDMFQHVCMVTTTYELTREDLDMVIQGHHHTGDLVNWLEKAALR